jgi:hypothetical protein
MPDNRCTSAVPGVVRVPRRVGRCLIALYRRRSMQGAWRRSHWRGTGSWALRPDASLVIMKRITPTPTRLTGRPHRVRNSGLAISDVDHILTWCEVRSEADLLAILDGAPMMAATSTLTRRADVGGVADQVSFGPMSRHDHPPILIEPLQAEHYPGL